MADYRQRRLARTARRMAILRKAVPSDSETQSMKLDRSGAANDHNDHPCVSWRPFD